MILTWLMAIGLAPVAKRKFEETFPVAVISVSLITYFCAYLRFMSAAVPIVALCVLALFIICFVKYKNMAQFKQIVIDNIFTEGFVIMAIITIIIIFSCKDQKVVSSDDLNYWGTFIRQMFGMEHFPSGAESVSHYSDYPPGMQMLACFFQIGKETYVPGRMFIAHFIKVYAFLLPLLTVFSFKKKAWYKTLFVTLPLFFIFPSFLTMSIYTGISSDFIGGILFGFIVYKICDGERHDKFYYAELILAFSLLSIGKSVMIYTAIVGIVFYLARNLQQKSWPSKKHKIISLSTVTIVPLVVWGSWKLFCVVNGNSSYLHVNAQNAVAQAAKHSLSLPDYAGEILRKYLTAFAIAPLNQNDSKLGILALAILIVFFVACFFFAKGKISTKTITIDVLILSLSFVFYCVGHYLTYIMLMGKHEAEVLSSFERYLSIFMPVFIYWLAFYGKQWWNELKWEINRVKKAVCIFAALLFLPFSNLRAMANNMVPSRYESQFRGLLETAGKTEEKAEQWKQYVGDDIDHILIIYDTSSWYQFAYLTYAVTPIPYTHLGQYDGLEDPQKYLNDVRWSVEGMSCNYIYIADFCTQTSTPLTELTGGSVEPNSLYKVEKSGEQLKLKLLYNGGVS